MELTEKYLQRVARRRKSQFFVAVLWSIVSLCEALVYLGTSDPRIEKYVVLATIFLFALTGFQWAVYFYRAESAELSELLVDLVKND